MRPSSASCSASSNAIRPPAASVGTRPVARVAIPIGASSNRPASKPSRPCRPKANGMLVARARQCASAAMRRGARCRPAAAGSTRVASICSRASSRPEGRRRVTDPFAPSVRRSTRRSARTRNWNGALTSAAIAVPATRAVTARSGYRAGSSSISASISQPSASTTPLRMRRPSVNGGTRPSPGGRASSQRNRVGRCTVGASSSIRAISTSAPRLRMVDHGRETSTRSARSRGVVSPGMRAVTLRTSSCGVPRRR